MTKLQVSKSRAMRVCVAPGSTAERVAWYHAAGTPSGTTPEALAAGFFANPRENLHDRGGKIIQDLVFTNFYLGGDDAWDSDDIRSIDGALAAAMSDRGLNNVMIQYFRGAAAITSTFRPSRILPGSPPDSFSRDDVEALVGSLHDAGTLGGFDFDRTVFNFLLPQGTVLTIDDGSGDDSDGERKTEGPAGGRQKTGEVEEAATSLRGLGGFHGSVQAGSDTVYYAIGVFSEGRNGIVAFDQPWKNVVATMYHELNEARTDADVEQGAVAWVTNGVPSEEIGDTPMRLARGNLALVMKEVALADGSGTVPIQLMWSNAVSGPEGPVATPRPPTA